MMYWNLGRKRMLIMLFSGFVVPETSSINHALLEDLLVSIEELIWKIADGYG